MSAPQRVLIVDDHPLFRKGLSQLLQTVADLLVVGEATGGVDGLEQARALAPDLVLLDHNMRDMSGLELLRELRAARPALRVVMITVSDQAEDLVAALQTGADGYLLKDMEPEAMLEALRQAADGRSVVSDDLTHHLVAAVRGDARPPSMAAAGPASAERVGRRRRCGRSMAKLPGRDRAGPAAR